MSLSFCPEQHIFEIINIWWSTLNLAQFFIFLQTLSMKFLSTDWNFILSLWLGHLVWNWNCCITFHWLERWFSMQFKMLTLISACWETVREIPYLHQKWVWKVKKIFPVTNLVSCHFFFCNFNKLSFYNRKLLWITFSLPLEDNYFISL